MDELLLVRYGEIFLKGLNRPFFLKTLVRNVKDAVHEFGARVWLNDGRIFISGFQDMEACASRVCRVFGIHSVCPAVEMDKGDFSEITKKAVELMNGLSGSFKVSARRSDKQYPMNSPEINGAIGHAVLEGCPQLKVDLHHPDHVLNVEIRDRAYLYVRVIPAVGGMPVGTSGKAALLLSGGIDSPVAGYMIAKRGVEISGVHFHSYPYTSDRAREKVIDLARILSEYTRGMKLYIIPFTRIQMLIHEKCPEDYTTLIMRRFMMRIAQKCAERESARALITGESIGQVASQTMEALCTTDAVADMPVFRPLIGFDKSEIIEIARKIGTYEVSSLPYEDCCTVFTPRHPVTHPRPDKVAEAEAVLDVEALVQEAVDHAEILTV